MLRLHRSFVDAPDDTLRAVAVFASSRRGSPSSREALAKIREHFSRHCRTTPSSAARRTVARPVGEVFDLREVFAEINRSYFGGRLKARITWGKAAAGRAGGGASTSLQLGSYSYEDKLIRVHGMLDEPSVPRYVVEAVVHHEMLHAAIPPVVRNGRRQSTRRSSAAGSRSSGTSGGPSAGSSATCPTCCRPAAPLTRRTPIPLPWRVPAGRRRSQRSLSPPARAGAPGRASLAMRSWIQCGSHHSTGRTASPWRSRS